MENKLPQPHLLFLSLDWYRTKDPKTPLAIASIEAFFNANISSGVSASFESFDIADSNFSLQEVLNLIVKEEPSILALGVYIWNERYVQKILNFVSLNYPSIEIILGGPQITFGDHRLIEDYTAATWFVKGDGEVPLVKLIESLIGKASCSTDQMRSLGIYSRIDFSQSCKIINKSKLTELPSPFLTGTITVPDHAPFQRWETLRGCPYKCTFCQFKIESMKPKEIPHERIFGELELFHEKKVKEIAVLDPIFNFQKGHYLPILEKISALEMKTVFSFQARLELLTRDHGKAFLEWCADYKKVKLEFGVQTFNDAESKLVKRNNHLGQMEKGIQLLHQYDIDFELHLILGLPEQTSESFLKSYKMAQNARPNRLYIFPLNLLKGTSILDRAEEWGYAWNPFNYNIFQSSKWMPENEVVELKEFANEINQQSKKTPLGKKVCLPDLSLLKSA